MARSGDGATRVLHAPYDLRGNCVHLARAEAELGFDARLLRHFEPQFGFPGDPSLAVRPAKDPLLHPSWWLAMSRIAWRCDVLHMSFGTSFLTDVTRRRVYADLPLWRELGLCTFVSFQGCEGRVSGYCTVHFDINACRQCRSRSFCENSFDAFKRECISHLGRYFDGIFATSPDLMHNLPRARFLPECSCDVDGWIPPSGYDWHHPGPVRVLHAPARREVEGTGAIIRAVDELRAEGESVDLVLVENELGAELRRTCESCDLLVDQLLTGWYGGLAVKLMALGKPVVAYIRQGDLGFLPPGLRRELPVLNAQPESLKEVLRALIRSPERRRELGLRSRRYVERWHHARFVAGITTEAYALALRERRSRPGVSRTRALLGLLAPEASRMARIHLRSTGLTDPLRRLRALARSRTGG